ncbi:MAG: hypothetical protein AMXMBFR33_39390 [Candidatus Xenobia bacterium]
MSNCRRGFTVLELLVSSLLLSMIGLATIQIFMASISTYSHQDGRIALYHSARENLERIVPLLVSAESVTFPLAGGTSSTLVFSAGRDYHNQVPYNPANPIGYNYRVRLVNNDILLELYNGDVATTTRVLGRSTPERTITGLSFTRPAAAASTVQVQVRVQGQVKSARSQLRTIDYMLETAAHVPSVTLPDP